MKKLREKPFIERLFEDLQYAIHYHYFPEEYDFHYDSLADARDRKRGIDPMSQDYTEGVNARRVALGVQPLNENDSEGTPSRVVAHCLTHQCLDQHREQLPQILEEVLIDIERSARLRLVLQRPDAYKQLAAGIISDLEAGMLFSVSVRERFIAEFGRETFDHRTINTMHDLVMKGLVKVLIDGFVVGMPPVANQNEHQ